MSEAVAQAPEKKRPKKRRRKIIRKLIVLVVVLGILGLAGFVVVKKLQADYRITYDPYTATVGSITNSLSYSGTMQLVNNKTYTADGTHRAEAVVTSVNGAEFSAETTAGDLYVGETVWLYRDADAKERIGKGTVTVHDTLTVSSSGTVRNLRVQAGDTVERGQWLYSVSSAEDTNICIPADGIVTEVSASAGSKVKEGQELAVIAVSCGIRIEVAAEDVKQFRTGGVCTYYRGDDPHETAYNCTVSRILLNAQGSTATVELLPEEGELLTLGMSVRVETD